MSRRRGAWSVRPRPGRTSSGRWTSYSDALFDGRRIRAPALVDNSAREALAIVVDGGNRGEHVVRAVEEVAAQRDPPCLIRVDNGPEFVSKVLDCWAYERGVVLDSGRPGKPTDNCFVESSDGRFRDGSTHASNFDTHWFLSVEDAKAKIEVWRRDTNATRPHSALGHLTPLEFAARTARKGR